MLAEPIQALPRSVKPLAMNFQNACFVDPGDDLSAKYNWLKSSDRDSVMGVLSTTNRRILVLAPGRHTVTSTFTLDTKFVDVASLTPINPDTTVIYGNFAGNVVEQTAINVRLSGFSIISDYSIIPAFAVNAATTGSDATISVGRGQMEIAATGIGIGVVRWKDYVYLTGGGITPGLYLIDGAVTDDQINISGEETGTNVTYAVISITSEYRHMNFDGAAGHGVEFTQNNAGGHGLWEFCRSDDLSWRLAVNTKFVGVMNFCIAEGSSFGGDAVGAELGGEFYRCEGGDNCFGGCGTFGIDVSATLIECVAGNNSYAIGMEFSGVAKRCIGKWKCFAGYSIGYYGTFSGYAEDCVAAKESFGSGHANCVCSGELVRCKCTAMPESLFCTGAKIKDTYLQVTGTDKNCIDLNDGNTQIHGGALIANGAGKSIYAGEAQNVLALHCRMNLDKDANVTNLVGDGSLAAGYCIVDSDVD